MSKFQTREKSFDLIRYSPYPELCKRSTIQAAVCLSGTKVLYLSFNLSLEGLAVCYGHVVPKTKFVLKLLSRKKVLNCILQFPILPPLSFLYPSMVNNTSQFLYYNISPTSGVERPIFRLYKTFWSKKALKFLNYTFDNLALQFFVLTFAIASPIISVRLKWKLFHLERIYAALHRFLIKLRTMA